MSQNLVRRVAVLGVAGAIGVSSANAQVVTVTVENLSPSNGVALTPLFLGFHNGSFDVFDVGGNAGDFGGLEEVAEVGDTSVLASRFASEQPSGVSTTFANPFGPPPVFLGGSTSSTQVNVGDATVNRYFNFVGMVVPTNDLFVGNSSAIELFDAAGNFNGPVTILVRGRNVYDAGTEVNDVTDGPAFVAGVDGSLGTSEDEAISAFFDLPGAQAYADSLVGLTAAPGFEIGSAFTASTELYRITIVPAPGAASVLAGAGLLAMRRRR